MNEFIWLSSTVILCVLGFLRADSMCEKNLAPCFNLIFFFFSQSGHFSQVQMAPGRD